MARQVASPLMVSLVIVGILATGAFIYYQVVRDVPSPELPPPPPAPDEPEPVAEADRPRLDLPELADSDSFLRPLVAQLSNHPELARWLTPDRLVERFVTSVTNVARGESPSPHLRFLGPEGRFRVDERGGRLYVDEASYQRFDVIAEVFTSLDTADGVRLYRELEPLFVEAYGQLGYPSEDFRTALAKAIDHVLATPLPSGAVEVERRIRSYAFADPALESLSDAQKHFLRMGARNMREIQAKLKLMRAALDL